MTRTRNGSIAGTNDYDVDVDAPVFQRVVQEAVQDLHMIYDAATGENNPAVSPVVQVIDHSGAEGSGSQLGIPPAQQYINVNAALAGGDIATYGLYDDDYNIILLAAPIRLAAGDNALLVEVDGVENDQEMIAELRDSDWALVDSIVMTPGVSSQSAFFHSSATTSASYVVIRWRLTGADLGTRILGWRAHCARYAPVAWASGSSGSPYPITTPATSAPIAWERIDDAMMTDDYALPGHLTTLLNRMTSALWEWATGAPVPGNQALQQADYGGTSNPYADGEVTAPTTSRFKDASLRGFANAPMPAFPVFSEALGAFGWDGSGEAWSLIDTADPPTAGMLEWYAPYVKATSWTRVRSAFVVMPDFPSASPNALYAEVLAITEMTSSAVKYTPTNWSVRITEPLSGTSASVAFTQMGTSPFFKAQISDVPFSRDTNNEFQLELDTSGAYQFGELIILGWNLFFAP